MIITNRCILTAVQESDYEDIKKVYLNEKVRQYLGGTVREESIDGVLDIMLNSDGNSWYFCVRYKQTNDFIGLVSLDPHHTGKDMEVSYQLIPKWWGAGYATEVITEIIGFAFTILKLPRLVAETQVANIPSRKLLEKVGMRLISTYDRFDAEQALYYLKSCDFK
ncbi:GNAT family N-acetyltransferase [Virgibacillus sp. C22-A2]|uniref:GNAT family N-acetyltransferase n=1 Tax=Virgibacillus tibetensis TaxID=3042313 RepID=A0ABU6KK89_9BACI|nr:GNAT family N-acetyltransferase [Virgibacillus sp. C22-A2]